MKPSVILGLPGDISGKNLNSSLKFELFMFCISTKVGAEGFCRERKEGDSTFPRIVVVLHKIYSIEPKLWLIWI